MQTRRNFFQLLGLGAGAAALGGKAVAATIIPNKEKTDAVKKIEENNNSYGEVTIQRDYGQGRNYDFFIDSSGNVRDIPTSPPARKMSEVSMTPGPDGELYLKLNGKWRKIVTE